MTTCVGQGRPSPIFLKISLKRGMKNTIRNAIANVPITIRRIGYAIAELMRLRSSWSFSMKIARRCSTSSRKPPASPARTMLR